MLAAIVARRKLLQQFNQYISIDRYFRPIDSFFLLWFTSARSMNRMESRDETLKGEQR